MSIIYENRHKGTFLICIQTNVASIDFNHFNDDNKSIKDIRSYFEGELSISKGDYYVPIESFIPELTKYVESL
ncbi:hypothetical protein HX021_08175 [Sphingobacterium sp. N143]|uniref:hypothetical protein n=1 Tax=Sphingobacterium sp. N143 TaxID=2746727 RepID=UPI002575D06D|nr:hypothetical protein [Sphingobacterium sp. N143]MDM1294273.1 hypothetical protein [Sphingobacterium sp. N143]